MPAFLLKPARWETNCHTFKVLSGITSKLLGPPRDTSCLCLMQPPNTPYTSLPVPLPLCIYLKVVLTYFRVFGTFGVTKTLSIPFLWFGFYNSKVETRKIFLPNYPTSNKCRFSQSDTLMWNFDSGKKMWEESLKMGHQSSDQHSQKRDAYLFWCSFGRVLVSSAKMDHLCSLWGVLGCHSREL